MQENKKKLLMISVIVVSLAIAAAVTFFVRDVSQGIDSIGKDEKMLVKCSNPSCNAEYETGKREYYEFLQKNANPMSGATPPLICEKCKMESIYRAIVCENCNSTFFYGEAQNDFKDRCPKCGFSKTEEMRKKAKK
jgi:phage FluMu protein Com